MQSELFTPGTMVSDAQSPGMTLQNRKSIKYAVAGECLARQGAMVAFAATCSSRSTDRGWATF